MKTGFSNVSLEGSEVWAVGAYCSEGKTSAVLKTAYLCAYEEGKKVVFFTNETTKSVLMKKMDKLANGKECKGSFKIIEIVSDDFVGAVKSILGNEDEKVDLVIMDMVKKDSDVKNLREVAETIGAPIMFTYSVSRIEREVAEEKKVYSGVGGKVQSEVDVSLWLLRLNEFKDQNKVLVGMSKNYKGKLEDPIFVDDGFMKL